MFLGRLMMLHLSVLCPFGAIGGTEGFYGYLAWRRLIGVASFYWRAVVGDWPCVSVVGNEWFLGRLMLCVFLLIVPVLVFASFRCFWDGLIVWRRLIGVASAYLLGVI